jgi:hypothetical protein
MAKTVMVWLVAIIIVGFILISLFTDPVGSAHFVGSVFSHIWDALNAIVTFIKTLAAQA